MMTDSEIKSVETIRDLIMDIQPKFKAALAELEEMRAAVVAFKAWLESEDRGPAYPPGVNHASEEGNTLWIEWRTRNGVLAKQAVQMACEALAKYPPRKP